MLRTLTLTLSMLLLVPACGSDDGGGNADDTSGADDTTPVDTTAPDTTPFEDTRPPRPPGAMFDVAFGANCSELGEATTEQMPHTIQGSTGPGAPLFQHFRHLCPTALGEGFHLGATSRDVVYALTATVDAAIEVTLETEARLFMVVTSACDDTPATCITSNSEGAAFNVVNFDVVAGETYYVHVDGMSNTADDAGAFQLTVREGENCSDGIDNDYDEQIDCDDVECWPDIACTELCTPGDGNDDDGDNDVDCDDSDCTDRAVCDEGNIYAYPQGCTDGSDDDLDGLIDCLDPGCFDDPNCDEGNTDLYPEGCSDGVDNDSDGLTDCEDSNCADYEPCLRLMFVTVEQNGDLGGLAGADAICTQAAADASLGTTGVWKAWLSDSTASPATRMTKSAARHKHPNGKTAADSWEDLTDGSVLNPNWNFADGTVAEEVLPFWSNTTAAGEASTGPDCNGWTSASADDQGRISGISGPAWSLDPEFVGPCDLALWLLCVEQDAE